ncbi:MAG: tetratricopeptide repeat protein, partial [Chloroflexi bacterium]|nr:tetratricopeptide repeat protein [Chloroflexota bacterium]
LGVLAQDLKDYDEARKSLREGLALYRELGDQENIGNALGQLGLLAEVEGHYDEAERFLKQALEVFEKNKSMAVEKCKQDLKRVSKLASQVNNRVAR